MCAACDGRITVGGAIPGWSVAGRARRAVVAGGAAETTQVRTIAGAFTTRHVASAVRAAARQAIARAETRGSISGQAVGAGRPTPTAFADAGTGCRAMCGARATAACRIAIRMGWYHVGIVVKSVDTSARASSVTRASDTVSTRRRKPLRRKVVIRASCLAMRPEGGANQRWVRWRVTDARKSLLQASGV
jgi:hypothetical protein